MSQFVFIWSLAPQGVQVRFPVHNFHPPPPVLFPSRATTMGPQDAVCSAKSQTAPSINKKAFVLFAHGWTNAFLYEALYSAIEMSFNVVYAIHCKRRCISLFPVHLSAHIQFSSIRLYFAPCDSICEIEHCEIVRVHRLQQVIDSETSNDFA